ncbi:MAG: response regulator [Bacteroidia bacterium]|nr:response regulator [Bacteroidia bacterium]
MEHKTAEILLVEDNASDAELIQISLEEQQLFPSISIVRDGEKALDYVFARKEFFERKGEENPKLILLDLKLPKINGIEVLGSIKSSPETKSIPVVILTSSAHSKDIEECYRLGANSYIVKPIGFDEFSKIITHTVNYWLKINYPI